MKLHAIIEDEWDGFLLEKVLKNKFGLSKKLLRRLKTQDRIFINGKVQKTFLPVFAGNILEIDMDFEEETPFVEPQDIPLPILYEDDWMIALDKPPGIVVHPSMNHPDGTIANGLAYYYQKRNLKLKIRPVSRLDRDTSGIILFAKNPMIQDALLKQMRTPVLTKEYIGIVNGRPLNPCGSIILPIARKEGSLIQREISPDGALSITHYKILKEYPEGTLLKFILETGRTHQIRVHCQGSGFPLIGDTLYSEFGTSLIGRQALHSRRLKYIHPVTGKRIILTSPLPEDIKSLLQKLKPMS